MNEEQLAQQSEKFVKKNRPTGMSRAEKLKATALDRMGKEADSIKTPEIGSGELPSKKPAKKKESSVDLSEQSKMKAADALKDKMHNQKKNLIKDAMKVR